MGQCLLIDDSNKISAIHSLNLKVFTGMDVIWKPNLKESIALIDLVPNIDIIITKSRIQDEEVAYELLNYLQVLEVPPVVIVLGGDDKLDQFPNVHCLSPVVTHRELVTKTAAILGITAKDMASKQLPDMYEIPISYIHFLKEIVCDMFLLTSEVKGGSSQFVEVGTVGDDINDLKQNIAYYLKQGAKRFFIPTADRIQFVMSYTEQVLSTLGSGSEAPPQKKLEATSAAMDAVSSDLIDHGFNETTIKLANESIKSLTKFAKENTNSKILKLLATFLKSQMSFRFKRVQLTIILINHAIKHMDWGANEHIEKLSYVAFFHDILLYKDELAKIQSDEELENSALNERDRRIVRHHALWTLDLLKDYPETHMGATVLIKQHHGSINGIGFNENPGSNISPLAIVFIVCEAYATEMILASELEESIDHKKLLNKVARKYPKQQYQKILKTLINLTI